MTRTLRSFSTLATAGLLLVGTQALAQIPPGERDALIALYNSTNGADWGQDTGWMGPAGSECDWYGVDCYFLDTNVESVVLDANNLVGTLPGGLEHLTQLRLAEPGVRQSLFAGAPRREIPRALGRAGESARALLHYPAAVVGLAIITILIFVSIYAVIAIPYEEAVSLWRGDGNVWHRHPRQALPAWVNYFRSDDLPPSITFDSTAEDSTKQRIEEEGELAQVTIPFTFDFDYGDFPQDIIVDLKAQYEERGPHVTVNWVWPDGRERELTGFQPKTTDSYFVARDDRLKRRLRSETPHEALFLGAEGEGEQPVSGTYTLRVDALLFEPDSDVDATVTIMGQVYGLAGTDGERRDLMVALLWGTPVALAFGLVAAIAVSVGSMLVAAIGAWYGGFADRIVQYLTELNLILPFFPVALMVFTMYSRSIVTILGVIVLLTIFGSSVKSYRATFLQVRNEPYVEAALAYGASNKRIIARYMFPRLRALLLPRLIILVPTFVFLEATLAFLGVSDPLLPTWGKLIVAALSYGVNTGATHIVIAPLAVLFLTGFAFAMVGISLERVFEPRLRER